MYFFFYTLSCVVIYALFLIYWRSEDLKRSRHAGWSCLSISLNISRMRLPRIASLRNWCGATAIVGFIF